MTIDNYYNNSESLDEFEEELDFSNEYVYDSEDDSKESLEDLIDDLTSE